MATEERGLLHTKHFFVCRCKMLIPQDKIPAGDIIVYQGTVLLSNQYWVMGFEKSYHQWQLNLKGEIQFWKQQDPQQGRTICMYSTIDIDKPLLICKQGHSLCQIVFIFLSI